MSAPSGWVEEVADELLRIGRSLDASPGHMFGHPALYTGRRLAACAYGNGLAVKLPADRVEKLLSSGRAATFEPYGKSPMAEWAHLPATSRQQVADHTELITEALAFTRDPDGP